MCHSAPTSGTRALGMEVSRTRIGEHFPGAEVTKVNRTDSIPALLALISVGRKWPKIFMKTFVSTIVAV